MKFFSRSSFVHVWSFSCGLLTKTSGQLVSAENTDTSKIFTQLLITSQHKRHREGVWRCAPL